MFFNHNTTDKEIVEFNQNSVKYFGLSANCVFEYQKTEENVSIRNDEAPISYLKS